MIRFKKIFLFFKIFPLVIVLVLAGWIFFTKIVYVGKSYAFSLIPGKPSGVVENFAPEEIPFLYGAGFSLMSQDWNTFRVRVPKTQFSEVSLDIMYQNPDEQEDVRFGVLQKDGSYEEKSFQIFQPTFDALSPDFWEKMEEGDMVLWQRKPVSYESIDEFFKDLPSSDRLMTYNYDLQTDAVFRNTDANDTADNTDNRTVVRPALLGGYDFYTYMEEGGSLNLDVKFQDINTLAHTSRDIEVTVFDGRDEEIGREVIEAEEVALQVLGEPGAEKILSLNQSSLVRGYYRIHVEASKNILTKEIVLSSPWLVFSGVSFFFAPQAPATSLSLIGGNDFSVEAMSKEALQNIMIGEEQLTLVSSKTRSVVEYLSPSLEQPIPIHIEKGGLALGSSGYFAFDEKNIFLPFEDYPSWEERKWNQDVLTLSAYDFILMKKDTPQREGEWYYAKVSLDTSNVNFYSGVVEFRINAPYLFSEEKNLYLGQIHASLSRAHRLDIKELWDYRVKKWAKRWNKKIQALFS